MSATESLRGTVPGAGETDALVPVLRLEGGAPDPVALSTWHLALAASTAVAIPHDLFALWVFPASGGAVLLGPAALAKDKLAVAVPTPWVQQDELYRLEVVLRRAQYASVIAVPVRGAGRDVGLMLLGGFTPGGFGPAQALALYRLAARLEPSLSELAAALPAVAAHAALEPSMSGEELPEHLARAACDAVSGADLVRRVSGVLYPLLPHDRLEILIPGATDSSFVPLSGAPSRRRWGRSGGRLEPYADIVARFGNEETLLLEDLGQLDASEWPVGGGAGPVIPARAVLGARLRVAGQCVGYLLLGSVASDAYRPDDEELLALAGLILAPRVTALRVETEPHSAPPSPGQLPLVRAAEVLATTAHLGQGLAGFAAELGQLLPHQGLSVHLRRGEEEVIALDPTAPRPLADLPGVPLPEFGGAAILSGEEDWLVHRVDELDEVMVPLRVAGRRMGTLGVRSQSFDSYLSAAAITQQFADVLGPHLELLRRGTLLGSTGPKPSAARA